MLGDEQRGATGGGEDGYGPGLDFVREIVGGCHDGSGRVGGAQGRGLSSNAHRIDLHRYAVHYSHGFYRIRPDGGLLAEHYGIGSVQDGISHVRRLCSGRSRVGDHGFQHLGSGNDRLQQGVGAGDNAFLDEGNPFRPNFDPEVAPSYHNAVEGAQDIVGKVGGVVDGVAERLDTLAAAFEGTLVNTEGLSGEAWDFLEQNRDTIEDLVSDLRDTVRNLREFTRVLAEQPNAVLRGRAPQGRME